VDEAVRLLYRPVGPLNFRRGVTIATEKDQTNTADVLKEITRECKRAIEPLEIVTPPLFSEIYSTLAQHKGVDLEDADETAFSALQEQIEQLLTLNKQSARQIDSLDASSQKALDAMHENDAAKLQETIREIQQLREEIKRLKESLYKDALTKAYNRKWLDAHYLDESGRFTKKCTIAIVDLNNFKHINDSLGHVAGDKVLQFMTRHLMETGAAVIRYGGDEFILLFDGEKINEIKAAKKMQLSRKELLEKKLKFSGRTFYISFSYGVAEAEEGDDFTEILDRADKRLYQDKKAIKEKTTSLL